MPDPIADIVEQEKEQEAQDKAVENAEKDKINHAKEEAEMEDLAVKQATK